MCASFNSHADIRFLLSEAMLNYSPGAIFTQVRGLSPFPWFCDVGYFCISAPPRGNFKTIEEAAPPTRTRGAVILIDHCSVSVSRCQMILSSGQFKQLHVCDT